MERRIKPQLTTHARSLRGDMTEAEKKLWQAIRSNQIENCRFRRQHPIDPYIADFACIDKRVVIELDGGQHQDQETYDERRTEHMQAQGWKVVRFWNNDVLNNLDGVLTRIVEILTAEPPSPLAGRARACKPELFRKQATCRLKPLLHPSP
jgi:very-short-patch-repair endonuclease